MKTGEPEGLRNLPGFLLRGVIGEWLEGAVEGDDLGALARHEVPGDGAINPPAEEECTPGRLHRDIEDSGAI